MPLSPRTKEHTLREREGGKGRLSPSSMSRKARGLVNWLKYNARGNVTTGNAKKKKWAQKKRHSTS